MKAVFKHELSSYFTSLSGYIFGAFLLLFAGIYTMAYNIKNSMASFEYVLSGMPFVFLIIVPILTMRVLAEERRQRTDQLLYSLPLSMTGVVLGKYLAMLVIFAIPLAIVSVYPLVLSAFGSVYLPAAYGAIAGFFFLGAALIAIGTFISSVTESQAVAAGLCFVVLLVNYFLKSLAGFVSGSALTSFVAFSLLLVLLALVFYMMTRSTFVSAALFILLETGLFIGYLFVSDTFAGLFPTLLEKLSLFARFEQFVDGIFDVTALVYFITVSGVFLFLSVQSLEKRRWS